MLFPSVPLRNANPFFSVNEYIISNVLLDIVEDNHRHKKINCKSAALLHVCPNALLHVCPNLPKVYFLRGMQQTT
jgi:hypothetical protein